MGMPSPAAIPVAAPVPTKSGPAKPGPRVTAIASRSASFTPAVESARSSVG